MRGHIHHEELPFLVASYIEYIRKKKMKKPLPCRSRKKVIEMKDTSCT